jgi:hypothetical protein
MTLDERNVHEVCQSVDLTADQPVIDLSVVTFFRPFALIYLGMFLRHYNSLGKRFKLRPPEDLKARNYLTKQNFWSRFNFDPNTLDPSMLRRLTSSTSLNDIVDIERRPGIDEEIAQSAKEVIAQSDVSGSDLSLIEEIIAELVSNFARHSKGPLAALALQWYPNRREVALAIGDCGVGIRASLSGNPKYAEFASRPHHEAVAKAFEAGVSCAREGGLGLTTVMDNVEELKGSLALVSGDGYIRKWSGSRARYGAKPFGLSGVQIEIAIPTRRS